MDLQRYTDQLNNGEKITRWINVWDEILGEDARAALEAVRDKLLAAIDKLETFVNTVNSLVKAGEMLAMALIEAQSKLAYLTRSFITVLRNILQRIQKLLDVPLLHSELKMAPFIVYTTNQLLADMEQFNTTAPAVNSILQNMVTEWYNRPSTEDQLCFMLFIPGAVNKLFADLLVKSYKLVKMLDKDLANYKTALTQESQTHVSNCNNASDLLLLLAELYPAHKTASDSEIGKEIVKYSSLALDFLEKELLVNPGSVFYKQYTLNYKELEGVLSALATQKEIAKNEIPDLLKASAIRAEKSTDCYIETNFVNSKFSYLTGIYAVTSEGAYRAVYENIPLFISNTWAQSNTKYVIKALVALFTSFHTWKLKVYDTAAPVFKEEVALFEALNKIFTDIFGRELVDKYIIKSLAILPKEDALEKIVADYLWVSAFSNNEKEDMLNTHKNFMKLCSDLDYSYRSSLNMELPLFPSNILLKDCLVAGDSDLILVFSSADSIQPTGEYIKSGMEALAETKLGASRKLIGNLFNNANLHFMVTDLKEPGSEGLFPRWYGLNTSPEIDTWTGNKLFAEIMPEGLLTAVDDLKQYLQLLENRLGDFDSIIAKEKSILNNFMAIYDRYYYAIKDILDTFRKLVQEFNIFDLPQCYLALWKGTVLELPAIAMEGLYERNWANSTYGGIVLFGGAAALSGMLEAIKDYSLTEQEVSVLNTRVKNAMADTSADLLSATNRLTSALANSSSPAKIETVAVANRDIVFISELDMNASNLDLEDILTSLDFIPEKHTEKIILGRGIK